MKKLLLTLLASLALVACSASQSSQETITIEHAFGKVNVPAKPKRVAAIGWENQDTPLALGIVPVGMSAANYGSVSKRNLHPWTEKALKGKSTMVYNDLDGIDYEGIAKSKPDVILAAYSGLTKEEYKKLSAIAPVVAYQHKPWQTKWRDQTIENARGLNLEKEGKKKVKEVEALIQEKVASVPEIKGKTVAFAWINADDFSKFYVYSETDPRASYLMDLGMKLPKITQKKSDQFYVELSRENVDQLSDVEMMVMYGQPSQLADLQADALMNQIPAVKNGAVVFIDPSSELAGAATPSILSIPDQIDTYLALLKEAASHIA